jgi:N4-(beta-N-acetylglucosaminyl)-L-asparaginase
MCIRFLIVNVLSVLVVCSGTSFRRSALASWSFGRIALQHAIPVLQNNQLTAVDAVEIGIRAVELDNSDQYCVGVGGYPNADGYMEFDAAMMDHDRRYGAVMALKGIPNPISVARTVMEKSVHNVLVGDGALKWALEHGFELSDDVLTHVMKAEWNAWKSSSEAITRDDSHDTVCLICLDGFGRLAVGTSTSGWKYKHAGI